MVQGKQEEKVSIFGINMNTWGLDTTVKVIQQRIESGIFTHHVVVNVAKLVHAKDNFSLKKSIESSDIVSIDGMGVVWGARMLGHEISERVAGIDLFYRLLHMSALNGYPIFLLGAQEEVVHKTQNILKKKYPDLIIAGYRNGYFQDGEECSIVEAIRNSGARLLFVAITSPKKELFIQKWKKELGVAFVMGVGGTFDVVAGKVKRAPQWMQVYGIEWLYRVMQEPQRLWKRYLITNVKFLRLLLSEIK